MLSGGYSWRLFFYVEFAFAMALFILAFVFVEETSYDRLAAAALSTAPSEAEKVGVPEQLEQGGQPAGSAAPARKSFVQTLSPWGRVDPNAPFFSTIAHSFTYFLVPQSLWVITTFGINGQYRNIPCKMYIYFCQKLTGLQYVTLPLMTDVLPSRIYPSFFFSSVLTHSRLVCQHWPSPTHSPS